MTYGFQNLPVEASTLDGESWTLLKPIEYLQRNGRLIRAKVGTTTDGPSIPLAAQPITPKFGPVWPCGVIHDAAYRRSLEIQTMDGSWIPYVMPREQADALILEAMEAQGVPAVQRDLIYKAVAICGGKAFEQDRHIG